MTQTYIPPVDWEALSGQVGRLDANVSQLNGTTETLHHQIEEIRQMPARIDKVELRQSKINAAILSQAGRLGEYGVGISKIFIQLEQHDGHFDRIEVRQREQGERLDGIDRRLDGVDKRLDGIDERLEQVEFTQREHGIRLDEIDRHLEGVGKRLERVDAKVEEVVDVQRDHGLRLIGLEAQIHMMGDHINGKVETVVGVQRDHGRRLEEIDRRLDTMDERFDGIDQRLDKVDGRLDGVDGKLDRVLEHLGIADGDPES